MKIHPHSKLLMIGDSITDCGRNRNESLGSGYVRFIHNALTENYPQAGIQIINKGISGNTVRDLKRRWQRDVLDLKPDWLLVMIGINDVWQQMDDWMPIEMCVSIEEYERTLDELISVVAPSLKGLILMTPYVLEPGLSDPMRTLMDKFGEVARRTAKKYDAIFVDTQAAFDDVLKTMDSTALSEDKVHMNAGGHQILANAFLKAVE
ncbi:MAG: SGNH/GDSL hydrolase family protein [Anaerolineae bacterium]|jgi:lysophospholipase L1-like esterase|nr:SGNH/GDSL hydrolase family protein [Anaerolineae bacterium]MBT3712006.1 SGNH/GDSL hydrolase family protein [Anaerolineae bacterium]MBT4309326.1 SGNH/GDSL hydrolase family protein [Anaerolineae bacterium]MBT4458189.1 SGNH/GDSL hydrolase family protein [Anaerolineae bacterium]MBT4842317.1 SGNH/GDSL hydrolase family protein [Anaerolineae bacterium]